jgi:hypothetical protein
MIPANFSIFARLLGGGQLAHALSKVITFFLIHSRTFTSMSASVTTFPSNEGESMKVMRLPEPSGLSHVTARTPWVAGEALSPLIVLMNYERALIS